MVGAGALVARAIGVGVAMIGAVGCEICVGTAATVAGATRIETPATLLAPFALNARTVNVCVPCVATQDCDKVNDAERGAGSARTITLSTSSSTRVMPLESVAVDCTLIGSPSRKTLPLAGDAIAIVGIVGVKKLHAVASAKKINALICKIIRVFIGRIITQIGLYLFAVWHRTQWSVARSGTQLRFATSLTTSANKIFPLIQRNTDKNFPCSFASVGKNFSWFAISPASQREQARRPRTADQRDQAAAANRDGG